MGNKKEDAAVLSNSYFSIVLPPGYPYTSPKIFDLSTSRKWNSKLLKNWKRGSSNGNLVDAYRSIKEKGEDERDMLLAMASSKIEEKIDEYYKPMIEWEGRVIQTFIKLSENKGKLEQAKEEVTSKREMVYNENNRIQTKIRELDKYLGRDTTYSAKEILVKLVMPQEEIKKKMLGLEAKEKALEDALSECKRLFREKQVGLEEYLKRVRRLAEKQFIAIATQRKINAIWDKK